jgi:hypothetical protein
MTEVMPGSLTPTIANGNNQYMSIEEPVTSGAFEAFVDLAQQDFPSFDQRVMASCSPMVFNANTNHVKKIRMHAQCSRCMLGFSGELERSLCHRCQKSRHPISRNRQRVSPESNASPSICGSFDVTPVVNGLVNFIDLCTTSISKPRNASPSSNFHRPFVAPIEDLDELSALTHISNERGGPAICGKDTSSRKNICNSCRLTFIDLKTHQHPSDRHRFGACRLCPTRCSDLHCFGDCTDAISGPRWLI